ncbi:hypothetical protein OAI28_05830 [Methylophilaceae bacterium]|jgi:polysaccharide biosynthesis PFTS motif protein|nr:hypothetical protein [Methylophilaceae bacterium]
MNQISGLKSHMLSKFRNNLNALKNYKKIVRDDKFFLHYKHLQLLELVTLSKSQKFFFKKIGFDYSEKDIKAYIKAYLFGPNFNRYIFNPTFLNLINTRIPANILNKNLSFLGNISLYIVNRIRYLGVYFFCNLASIYLIAKAFVRSFSVSKDRDKNTTSVIYFEDLRKNNCIDTDLKSYLSFCMSDKNINPFFNKTAYSNNYSINNLVFRKDIVKGDFLTLHNIPSLIVDLIKLNLLFWINFLVDKSYFNLLFKEHFKKIVVDNSVKGKNFSFIFNNSQMGYTPLWAIGKFKKNYLIYYSINFGYNYDLKNNVFLYPIEYRLMNWDNIYVWDKVQLKTLKDSNPLTSFKIINKINFTDSGEEINLSPTSFNLVIFDVSPKRIYSRAMYANNGDIFYSKEYTSDFIRDIVKASKGLNVVIYLKEKRKILSICKSYSSLITNLSNIGKIVLINDEITPERIISQANFVISPVYSTPTLIASMLNIKSIFYDPFGLVDKKYEFSRGIKVVKKYKELNKDIHSAYTIWNKDG